MDPLLSIGLWVVLAFAMALFPSNDNHWRRAYVLIAIGVPLLIWIFWQHGVLLGILGLAVGGLSSLHGAGFVKRSGGKNDYSTDDIWRDADLCHPAFLVT
jgi:hypothetical protein